MSYAPYSAYKDSGVPWIGQVPEGWEVKRLRYASKLADERLPYDEVQRPYVGLEHIESWTGKRIPDDDARADGIVALFERGDVLFGKLRPYLAKVHRAEEAGCSSTEALILRGNPGLDTHFLKYFMLSPAFIDEVNATTYGAKMPRANWSDVGGLPVSLPPIEEQSAIADFLGEKTAEIDDLIEKKEELLRLLTEQRIALITHAVTKGLNPNTPMKPSGIDWLGDVPEGWDVFPLSALAEIRTGFAFSSDDFVDEGVPLIRISDVGADGVVTVKGAKRLPSEYAGAYSRYQVLAGDLLMAMTGATVGKAGLYSEPETALLNQRVCLLRARPNAETNFVRHLMNADFYQRYVRLTAFGGAQPNISDREIVACRVPVPPLDQQVAISDFLDQRIGETDKVAVATKRAIRNIKEYRTALITNAVTGKIKVA